MANPVQDLASLSLVCVGLLADFLTDPIPWDENHHETHHQDWEFILVWVTFFHMQTNLSYPKPSKTFMLRARYQP